MNGSQSPKFSGIAVSLVILLTGALGSCTKNERSVPTHSPPLLFFAVDGFEWNVMKPLLAEGKLPVMASLMERGTFGYLQSMQPTLSAVIWSSIATGKTSAKHGIDHFVYETSGSGTKSDYRYYTSGHRKTKAFWNILGDYNLRVGCVGWWMTYPAETVNGTMVSQTNTTGVLHDNYRALWKGALLEGVEGQVYPPALQNDVLGLLDEVDRSLDDITASIFGALPNPTNEFSQLMWDQTQWAFRADATYLRVARSLLEQDEPFDVFALYLGGQDVASHRFWRYCYPEQFQQPPHDDQIENFGQVINNYYQYIDRSIGELLALAPPNAAVMIVSDHGMHAINKERNPTIKDIPQHRSSGHHQDAPPGVFIAAGGNIHATPLSAARITALDLTRLRSVGGVLDILPTVFALKDIPIGEDFDGRVIESLVNPAWLEAAPIQYIKSHDSKEWAAAHAERVRDAVDQSERLEQLRSLGYIK